MLKRRVKSPGISMHTHQLDAAEVDYVSKTSNARWTFITDRNAMIPQGGWLSEMK